MKLHELSEAKFQSDIHQHDPSGNAGPTTVDPDKVDQMNRSSKIRRKWKLEKNMRKPATTTKNVKTDNEDLTGSGAHSVVNGPFNY